MTTTLLLLSLAVAAAAMLPWLRQGDWWIRIFDFPRLQLAGAGLALLIGYRFVPPSLIGYAGQAAVLAATLYQLLRIRAFTRLGPLQAQWAGARTQGTPLRLLIVNVYMPNRDAGALLSLVEKHAPDVLLAVETDRWWQSRLDTLADRYPYAVRHPLPNTYGMLLYSRYPLLRPEVRFLVEDGVPSIETTIEMPGAPPIRFHALHPRPPRPSKGQDSTHRDAELVIVGQQLQQHGGAAIVAGDLNDVAWSYTTDLFQRLSGLLDPRRGRGMYNSFHARIPLVRFPLDHLFHSDHFRVVRLQRLGKVGSDHFPLFIELRYEPAAARTQQAPTRERDDPALARELRHRPPNRP